MFGVIYAAEGSDAAMLAAVAAEFSPRIEACSPREMTLDLSGLARLFGDAKTIAKDIRRTAADRGLQIRVAIASTRAAARLLARHRAGLTVVPPGTEAAVLELLPLEWLSAIANDPNANDPHDLSDTFRRWGLRTLGDIAALPPDEVAARLGQEGVEWQRLARGEDPRPLVPVVPDERFEQALDLEWPIDGLEPLSFALGRVMEPLSTHLERRDRGAAVLHVRLHLVTKAVHERSLQLPSPMRDARTLRTLVLLDLESHPPGAAIDRVVVAVDPTPGRILQHSLLTRSLPSPEQVSTLMARLTALMGEGRCGSPVEVDSWQPGACAMKPFAPVEGGNGGIRSQGSGVRDPAPDPGVAVAFRRFRFPVPARVRVEQGRPTRVTTDRRGLSGGRVEMCTGPWRTSGQWWASGAGDPPQWDRDEWDVTLDDGATYRLFREREADAWSIEGIVD